jgi:cytochrome P450
MLNLTMKPEDRIPLEDIDLFDPERFRTGSQHPAWHTLRAEAPLWPQDGPNGERFWSVTRHADVLRVVKDHRTFSSEHGTILAVLGGDSAGGKTINLMDPPNHAGIRVPTMRLLSTSAVHRTTDLLRERVRRIIAPCRDGGVLDVVPLMLQLPMAVVGDIVGVPEELWPDVARWTMTGVAPEDPHYSTGSVEDTLRSVHFELFALFHDLVRERRANPREDIISMLLRAEIDGRKLTFEEVVLNCYSFVMGANTTTPHVASQLLLAFTEHEDQWRYLREHTAAAPRAVEEGLRWATPTNHLVRRTNVPVELAGGTLDAGELVCAWAASANRDSAVFQDPYRFDVTRWPNQHLAFGKGIHYCNGAPGARLVLRLLVEELTAFAARLELAGPVHHLRSNFINGITQLPVQVHPAGSELPRQARAPLAVCPVAHEEVAR